MEGALPDFEWNGVVYHRRRDTQGQTHIWPSSTPASIQMPSPSPHLMTSNKRQLRQRILALEAQIAAMTQAIKDAPRDYIGYYDRQNVLAAVEKLTCAKCSSAQAPGLHAP